MTSEQCHQRFIDQGRVGDPRPHTTSTAEQLGVYGGTQAYAIHAIIMPRKRGRQARQEANCIACRPLSRPIKSGINENRPWQRNGGTIANLRVSVVDPEPDSVTGRFRRPADTLDDRAAGGFHGPGLPGCSSAGRPRGATAPCTMRAFDDRRCAHGVPDTAGRSFNSLRTSRTATVWTSTGLHSFPDMSPQRTDVRERTARAAHLPTTEMDTTCRSSVSKSTAAPPKT
jgi:hypothetical protein